MVCWYVCARVYAYVCMCVCVPVILTMYLNGVLVDIATTHSDLDILSDDQLKFHDHTTQVTIKANQVLGMIKKSFKYLNSTMLINLFSTLVCPSYPRVWY